MLSFIILQHASDPPIQPPLLVFSFTKIWLPYCLCFLSSPFPLHLSSLFCSSVTNAGDPQWTILSTQPASFFSLFSVERLSCVACFPVDHYFGIYKCSGSEVKHVLTSKKGLCFIHVLHECSIYYNSSPHLTYLQFAHIENCQHQSQSQSKGSMLL